MTKTAIKAANTAADASAANAPDAPGQEAPTVAAGIGRYVELHPDHLVVDEANVNKSNVQPSARQLASVEELGVRDAISVRPLPDGMFGVFKGQRRMLAAQAAAAKAREAGRPVRLVPAFVYEGDDFEAVLLSLVENDHREDMTEGDKVAAVAQLSLLSDADAGRRGRTARALGMSAQEVAAAQRARNLKAESLNRAAAAGYDLLQLADLTEVEDVPDALHALGSAREQDLRDGTGGRGHWEHAMSRLRQQRELIEHTAATRAELEAAGVATINRPTYHGYGEKPKTRELTELRTPLGNPLTATSHAGCPGHGAWIDRESGDAVFACKDPAAYGHKPASNQTAVTKRSPAERERHQRTVSHNRAWKAARPVRHKFITALAARPKVSDAVQLFCLSYVLHCGPGSRRYAEHRDLAAVARFLGQSEPKPFGDADPLTPAAAKAMKGRRTPQLLVAHVAAVIESEMGDRAWDHPEAHVTQWLSLLAGEGYTLSEVEAEITGTTKTAPAKTALTTAA